MLTLQPRKDLKLYIPYRDTGIFMNICILLMEMHVCQTFLSEFPVSLCSHAGVSAKGAIMRFLTILMHSIQNSETSLKALRTGLRRRHLRIKK